MIQQPRPSVRRSESRSKDNRVVSWKRELHRRLAQLQSLRNRKQLAMKFGSSERQPRRHPKNQFCGIGVRQEIQRKRCKSVWDISYGWPPAHGQRKQEAY